MGVRVAEEAQLTLESIFQRGCWASIPQRKSIFFVAPFPPTHFRVCPCQSTNGSDKHKAALLFVGEFGDSVGFRSVRNV